jgi:fructan beta-fructosidase
MQTIKNILFLFVISICSFTCSDTADTQAVSEEMSNLSPDYYQELHRPQFHFSPEANWMNDPNGMVYYEGEYHLFYQYYPDSTVWGPMHWGHVITTDLVHWEHLPIALYPDSLGYIFSGSAVMDWENTSGLGENGQPPMIAIFTHHDIVGERNGTNDYQYQSIAYSNDKGRSWTKYKGNPVVPNPGIKDFRDPKVFWYEQSEHWVMVFAAYDKVQIYTSSNLIDWTFTSEFGIPGDDRLWECPDLFPLTFNDPDEGEVELWVLITSIQQKGPNGGTATSYFLGDFDGQQFIGNNEALHWLDYGRDNYALVSWSDVPNSSESRLAIGWMSNWQYAQIVPTAPWRSAMTIPRQLYIYNTPLGLRVASKPAKEFKALRKNKFEIPAQTLSSALNLNSSLSSADGLYELLLEFSADGYNDLSVELTNAQGDVYAVGYDPSVNEFFSDRTQTGNTDFSDVFAKSLHTAPRILEDSIVKLHLFFDVASAELFADDGTVVITDIYFPDTPMTKIKIKTGGKVDIKSGSLYSLKSIWQKK